VVADGLPLTIAPWEKAEIRINARLTDADELAETALFYVDDGVALRTVALQISGRASGAQPSPEGGQTRQEAPRSGRRYAALISNVVICMASGPFF
jgi:hypothetical protein